MIKSPVSNEKSSSLETERYAIAATEFVAKLPAYYQAGGKQETGIGAMTTPNELMFLDRYARDLFAGEGKIVDLGCWFGATTAALAGALKESGHAQSAGVIEAFDLFEWADWMAPFKGNLGVPEHLRSGDCFLGKVQEDLDPYRPLVILHKKDLAEYRPPEEWRIEFLFVDAMKTWDLAAAIAKRFFPLVIPGRSLVVQQDFAWHGEIIATNHLIMWALRDFFEPLHHVPSSCSMVFRTKRTTQPEEIPDFHPGYFTEQDVEKAYEYCLPMVEEPMRVSLLVAKLSHAIAYRQRGVVARTLQQLQQHKGLRRDRRVTIEESLSRSSRNADAAWLEELASVREALAAFADA